MGVSVCGGWGVTFRQIICVLVLGRLDGCLTGLNVELPDSSDGTLTAPVLIAAICTVWEAIAVEPPNDAVAIGTWEESRGAFGPHPGCEGQRMRESKHLKIW